MSIFRWMFLYIFTCLLLQIQELPVINSYCEISVCLMIASLPPVSCRKGRYINLNSSGLLYRLGSHSLLWGPTGVRSTNRGNLKYFGLKDRVKDVGEMYPTSVT